MAPHALPTIQDQPYLKRVMTGQVAHGLGRCGSGEVGQVAHGSGSWWVRLFMVRGVRCLIVWGERVGSLHDYAPYPTSPCGQTDACESITFPCTTDKIGNNTMTTFPR